MATTEDVRRYQDIHCAILGCKVIKINHTFAVIKDIRLADRSRAYGVVLTILNEFNRFIAQFCTQTKSLDGVADALRQLEDNYEKLGQVCIICMHVRSNEPWGIVLLVRHGNCLAQCCLACKPCCTNMPAWCSR